MESFESFDQFWDYYLGEHRDPANRALHYVGTSLALGTAAAGVLSANPVLLLAAPVVGYAPAWIGHFVFEKNRPATLRHPLWSLRGDLRMLKTALRGEIQAELARIDAKGVRSPTPRPSHPPEQIAPAQTLNGAPAVPA